MKLNKLLVLIPFCVALFIAPASFDGASESTRASADGWQTLGDSGIEYRYGLNKEQISESVFFEDEFFETNTSSTTTTETHTIEVPTNWNLIDFYHFRLINKTKGDPKFGDWGNLTREEGEGWAGTFGQDTINWRINGFVNESWATNYTAQYEAGIAGPNPDNTTSNWRENWWADGPRVNTSAEIAALLGDPSIENVTIPVVDWRGQILTNISVGWHYVQYLWWNRTSGSPDPEVVFEEILIPAFALVEVEHTELELIISAQTDYKVEMHGSFNMSASYEETVWGHDVEVKLPGHYHLAYRAIENATGTYSLSSGFAVGMAISLNQSIEVKFANNSVIPAEELPGWLHSTNITIEGDWSFKYEETATFFGVTALQGIVQGMLTKLSNDSYADLLIWGGWKPGRMFGYVDLDGNDRLDIKLNGSEIVSPDAIFALGLPEGIHLEGSASATTAEESRFTYLDSVAGYFESQETSQASESASFDFVHGFDPALHQGNTTLDWQEPSYDSSTGKAQFEWTLNREDWPVLWYVANRTHSDTVLDTMDFSDTYNLEIDTDDGMATLSNDYTQSAVTDPTLAAMVADLSLATYHRDIFLSVTALEKGMDPATAQKTDVNDISIGGVSVATAVFGDTKANYTIGTPPSEHTTSTTVLNLLTMSGQIGDTSTIEGDAEGNPFISPVAQRVALGMVQLTADGLDTEHEGNVTWLLSENVVVTSYPEWGGDGPIVHDPTFTATFAEPESEPSSEPPASGPDGSSEPESESIPAAASAAGVFVVGSLLLGLSVIRRRTRK
ncbi:MAG: hypothetical protein ACE5OZ_15685 [Candidatus Heimdallarchaeota archaeon]